MIAGMRGDDAPEDEDRTEKRAAQRVPVMLSVDCETDETFLFASITNISELGIFISTTEPLSVGTELRLRFAPALGEEFIMRGRVQWINEWQPFGRNLNPGMGVMFIDLKPQERERLVEVIRTIAYLRGDPVSTN